MIDYMAPYNAIFDEGFAIRQYDISNDRWAFRYKGETFSLNNSQAEAVKTVSTIRDTTPQLWVCPIYKLREIVG